MHSELITRVKLSNVSIVSHGYLCLYTHMLLCIVRSMNIFSLYKPQAIQWFQYYFLCCAIIHNNEDVETTKILLCAHAHTHKATQTCACMWKLDTIYQYSSSGAVLEGLSLGTEPYLQLGQSRRALRILLPYLCRAGTTAHCPHTLHSKRLLGMEFGSLCFQSKCLTSWAIISLNQKTQFIKKKMKCI